MEQQSMADPQSKTDPSANASPNPNSTPAQKSANGHPQGSPNGEAGRESVLMGSDSVAQSESENPLGSARKAARWSTDLMTEFHASSNNNDNSHNLHFDGSNPYVSSSGVPSSSTSSSSFKDTMGSVRDMLGRWRTKVGEATRKAEELAGNTWQHLNTGPSFTDAALGRIAQGTKVLAEGGYETIFRQTFETVPDELLENSFACYLSTSAGPVMGILYISTAKLAFCSDNPLSYKSGAQTEWSYYKVVIPLHQLKAVNPSSSKTNTAEKYVQAISVDNHEFWFMGFLSYDGAVKCLQDALQSRDIRSA